MSETLRDLRLQNKKTCAEVAQALNVTKNAVSNYESGIRNISLEQVVSLARLYDCSEREIIDAALNSRFSR
ncbi:MAG TPA: transcriptional regulator [Clostridiales bacterium]|nr:transcriptional regulator [Clostridiales bacterium]